MLSNNQLGIDSTTDQFKNLQLNDSNVPNTELLYHVLLPRFIPQEVRGDFYELELKLLFHFINVARDLYDQAPNIVNTLREFYIVQKNLSPATIHDAIDNLEPGETFAMFIKGQNCALMINMPLNANKKRQVIVATFPIGLNRRVVNSDPGDFEVIRFFYYIFHKHLYASECERFFKLFRTREINNFYRR